MQTHKYRQNWPKCRNYRRRAHRAFGACSLIVNGYGNIPALMHLPPSSAQSLAPKILLTWLTNISRPTIRDIVKVHSVHTLGSQQPALKKFPDFSTWLFPDFPSLYRLYFIKMLSAARQEKSWQTSGLRISAFKSGLKLSSPPKPLSQSKIPWLSLTLHKIPWRSRRNFFSLTFPEAWNPDTKHWVCRSNSSTVRVLIDTATDAHGRFY